MKILHPMSCKGGIQSFHNDTSSLNLKTIYWRKNIPAQKNFSVKNLPPKHLDAKTTAPKRQRYKIGVKTSTPNQCNLCLKVGLFTGKSSMKKQIAVEFPPAN